jgi:hypothetical protein
VTKDQAFRAAIARGLTTEQAVKQRYREASLDSAEGTHRAPVMASEAQPPTEAEMLEALKERSQNGWAPVRKDADMTKAISAR